MRQVRIIFALLLSFSFWACEKDEKQPGSSKVPLVKEVASTYTSARIILKYGYDSQNKLITSSGGLVPLIYNAGGAQIKQSRADGKSITTDIVFENGRIGVLIYTNQLDPQTWKSTFSYDSKGRLSKIQQSCMTPFVHHVTRTYTWDDNDNLLSSKRELSKNNNGTINSTSTTYYSGFLAENSNSLGARNFGFDYFGTAGYPGDFTPSDDGSSSNILPGQLFAGKTLPSSIQEGSYFYSLNYIKNAQGLVERVEKTINGPGIVNVKEIMDVAYL